MSMSCTPHSFLASAVATTDPSFASKFGCGVRVVMESDSGVDVVEFSPFQARDLVLYGSRVVAPQRWEQDSRPFLRFSL